MKSIHKLVMLPIEICRFFWSKTRLALSNCISRGYFIVHHINSNLGKTRKTHPKRNIYNCQDVKVQGFN